MELSKKYDKWAEKKEEKDKNEGKGIMGVKQEKEKIEDGREIRQEEEGKN